METAGIARAREYLATFGQGDIEAVRDFFARVRPGDRHLDVLMAQTFKNGPDGRWTEYFAMPDDQVAVNAFWGAA